MFLHVAIICSFYSCQYYSLFHLPHFYLPHLSILVDGCIDCFYYFTIMNNAAMRFLLSFWILEIYVFFLINLAKVYFIYQRNSIWSHWVFPIVCQFYKLLVSILLFVISFLLLFWGLTFSSFSNFWETWIIDLIPFFFS